MSARVILFLASVVLAWTAFPTQERSAWAPAWDVVALEFAAGAAGDVRSPTHRGPASDPRLDELQAQPQAENAADLSELMPVASRGTAASRRTGWGLLPSLRVRVPPHLEGPKRPPDASRLIA